MVPGSTVHLCQFKRCMIYFVLGLVFFCVRERHKFHLYCVIVHRYEPQIVGCRISLLFTFDHKQTSLVRSDRRVPIE